LNLTWPRLGFRLTCTMIMVAKINLLQRYIILLVRWMSKVQMLFARFKNLCCVKIYNQKWIVLFDTRKRMVPSGMKKWPIFWAAILEITRFSVTDIFEVSSRIWYRVQNCNREFLSNLIRIFYDIRSNHLYPTFNTRSCSPSMRKSPRSGRIWADISIRSIHIYIK